ncbi:uncharacterized protein GGS22DRAFT_70132 [Annulohypoxylon maeteangense]|uniref:uncharacterized protein n=1 Tax=Annulohypoxylon maeteangense TaxID=1927788 RepID=UPI002008E0D9|nr:uncharacterized protein GGS22DRAFT_70132 [Annulohypoxylon maeteangense]KAI0889349.1 hypothetical protein GGS22DRAFT_70132 [Annulohypoxylon maeteangense]
MASTRLAAPPTCLSCLRRLALPSLPLAQQQTRGVKMTKAEEEDTQGIPVRLLHDMPGFGAKDAIIRVTPGRMRNQWFPKGQAEYMTKKRFQELQLSAASIGTRDRTYGSRTIVDEGETSQAERRQKWLEKKRNTAKKDVIALAPDESLALLKEHIPKTLTFTRKPIQPAAPAPTEAEPAPQRSPSLAHHAVTSTSANVPEPEPLEPAAVSIFGSVSTTDILTVIKEKLLASDPVNGGRVALEASGITIAGLEEGEDRIKHLGTFKVSVLVAAKLEPVKLNVKVVAEE